MGLFPKDDPSIQTFEYRAEEEVVDVELEFYQFDISNSEILDFHHSSESPLEVQPTIRSRIQVLTCIMLLNFQLPPFKNFPH